MSIVVTHPGKLGDLVWSLATVRALSEKLNEKVILVTSPYCRSLLPMLKHQMFIKDAVVDDDWEVLFEAPVKPWRPPDFNYEWEGYCYAHLGMREWPAVADNNLWSYYRYLVGKEYGISLTLPESRWLLPWQAGNALVTIAWTDEWAELKAGLTSAIARAFPRQTFELLIRSDARLANEFLFPANILPILCGMETLVDKIASSRLLITCNSLAHALANALGVRTLVVEPSVPRHQEVFKHRISSNTYHDGFDAREVCAKLEGLLAETKGPM